MIRRFVGKMGKLFIYFFTFIKKVSDVVTMGNCNDCSVRMLNE